MVEFGLSMIFFVLFLVLVADLLMLGYNLNITQQGLWEASRKLSTGASDKTIKNFLYDEVAKQYFPSMFMQMSISNLSTSPSELYRVNGKDGTVSMTVRLGISILGLSPTVVEMPMKSTLMVVVWNDEDDDGLNDLKESFPNDHDNDGLDDSTDTDDDNDGIIDSIDTGIMQYNLGTDNTDLWKNSAGGLIYVGTLAEDRGPIFHSREIYYTSKVPAEEVAPANLYYRIYPKISNYVVRVDLSRDWDNDAWDDKYDNYPSDDSKH